MATYYIKTGGNDAASGLSDALAWETVTKLNSFADSPGFSPGDIIKFRKGDTWNITANSPDYTLYPNSGTGAGVVTLTSYTMGSSLKPVIKSSTTVNSGWTNISGNIWQNSNADFIVDVGNILFNGGTSVGVKMKAIGDIVAQGDFWYDFVNARIRMYSVGDPTVFYSDIECLLKYNLVEVTSYKSNTSYITFDGLSFQRTAAHGIMGNPCDHITITNCDFSYIGGADLYNDYTVRYGNAVEFYGSSSYNTVTYCTFFEIYDTGITNQDLSSGSPTVTYMSYHHNIFYNIEWPFEYCLTGGSTVHNHIYFEHNDVINAGGQMTHTQRWQGEMSSDVMLWGSDMALTNGFIRNNIFHQDNGVNNAGAWHAIVQYGSSDDGFVFDYNLFDLALADADIYTGLWPVYVDCKTLIDWRATSGKDANSVAGTTDFVTNFTDLHLQATSDAISIGVDCGYSVDFDGVTLASPPSVGAYELVTNNSVLTVDECFHGQIADNIKLNVNNLLAPAGTFHGLISDNLILTTTHLSPPLYPPLTSPPISYLFRIGAVKILVSNCVVGVYLRWWFNGWHYYNFTNGYEIALQTESLGTQTTRLFSVISKIERPTRFNVDYAYKITIEGITSLNIGGFTGLLMAERVDQYEDDIWREVDITRGDHLIKDENTGGYILNFEITRKELPITSSVYQKSLRLYLGDTLCDMDDDEVVPVNKQTNDIAEMQDRQSDFTAQFKIRKTRAMKGLFELSGEAGINTDFPFREKECKLIQDNIEVITGGRIILDDVDEQYYYVSILSGNMNFFKEIEKLKLTDLILASTNHTWNAATMAATHAGNPDYVYPLCEPSDDGGIAPLNDDGDRVEMYGGWIWPFIKVEKIWNEIFDNPATGLKWYVSGKILTNDTFLKLFMPIINLKTEISSISNYHFSIVWIGRLDFTFFPLSPLDGAFGHVTGLGGADALFKGLGIYVTRYTATHKFRVSINSAWDDGVYTHVYLFSAAINVLELTLIWDSGTGGTVYEGEYAATVGEYLSIYITDQLAIEQYVIAITDIILTQINYGTPVTPHINLPDITQIDFIKMICNMFGLIPEVTARDKKIYFWNYLELYDNIPIARDWSAYLSERDDGIGFKFGDYAQDNYLRYRESNDVILDNGMGSMQVDDDTLPAKKDVVELPVSTCDEVTILTNIFSVDISRIAFNKWNATAPGSYDQEKSIDSRIVYIDYIRSIASPPYEKTFGIRPAVGPGGAIDIDSPKRASSLEVSFSNLIPGSGEFGYSGLSRLLTNTNLRRAKFNLPVYEVAGLKHYIPIYLSQYKAYFYVNKINNYVPGQLCIIDLIKL